MPDTVTVIPPGYRLTVTTWENDADNYNTEIIEGLTEEQVKGYVEICNACRSQYSGGKKGLSNLYDPDKEELKPLHEFAKKILTEHPSLIDEFDPSEDEDVVDVFRDHVLDNMGMIGSEFYLRVVETWTIELVPNPIVLTDVTEKFK